MRKVALTHHICDHKYFIVLDDGSLVLGPDTTAEECLGIVIRNRDGLIENIAEAQKTLDDLIERRAQYDDIIDKIQKDLDEQLKQRRKVEDSDEKKESR